MGASATAIDPIELSRSLIRRPSVTPADAGALDVLQSALERIGFTCHRLTFAEDDGVPIGNLYARIGDVGNGRVFCFAGHTDVVPPGDVGGWALDPFSGEIADGTLFGRGAVDMKSAIASFADAAQRFLVARGNRFDGAISLLITGDEEGVAINGTRKVLDWMRAKGERIDACIVGEPTCQAKLGDMIKIGRRGSLTGRLTVIGAQGHVAYPHLADNPIPRLVRALDGLIARRLDQGTDWFQPSNLEITTVDVGNPATNVIPAKATATFNIRFNDQHDAAALMAWIRRVCDERAGAHELRFEVSGEAFLTAPGALSELVAGAIKRVTGITPELSTTGGTSDARFIRALCPVVEFGLVGRSMHKLNENVVLADIRALSDIYKAVLDTYFAT
ncbi:MAG: succinyl-diaminopimelate desuccinylase [Alphaproteobacteria bacterium]|nr:succinyl-diaminopimelate desuccinylase [Alphaproteobacteria bacterium]